MTSRVYIVFAVLASAFMALSSLHAQRKIDTIAIDQAIPGQTSILTVTGEGFKGANPVSHVEVKVDNVAVPVDTFTVVSDSELKIPILFPQTGRTGRRHTYSVKVSGEGIADAIQPRPVTSIETPAIEPAVIPTPVPSDPEIAFSLDGVPMTDDSLAISFDAASGDSVSKTLVVQNVGPTRLLLSNLQTPPAFAVIGFPNEIPPDSSVMVSIRFRPDSGLSTNGTMSFTTNIPSRSEFSFELRGLVLPPTASTSVIGPSGMGKKLLFIIPIILTFVAALLAIRKIIVAKKIHIKPSKDLGKQALQSAGAIKSGFELSLKPTLNLGRSKIQVKGRLTKQRDTQQVDPQQVT